MVFINCYNNDRNRDIIVYGDSDDGTVYFTDSNTKMSRGHYARADHLKAGLTCIQSFEDGKCWIGYADGCIYQIELKSLSNAKVKSISHRVIHRPLTGVRVLSISFYDRKVCFSDGFIKTIESPSSDINLSEQTIAKLQVNSNISSAHFCSPDSLLTGHDDGQVLFWTIRSNVNRMTTSGCHQLIQPVHEFSGHMSQVQQIIHQPNSNWVASFGLSDVHVGVWVFADSSGDSEREKTFDFNEFSLATNCGSVVHMNECNQKLVVLSKLKTLLIFGKIPESSTTLEKRIQLDQIAIACFMMPSGTILIGSGSCGSLQLSGLNDNGLHSTKPLITNVEDEPKPHLVPSFHESLNIFLPQPITQHRISVSATASVDNSINKGTGGKSGTSSEHVGFFLGALRAKDNQVLKALLADRSNSEIKECVQSLPEELIPYFVEQMSWRLRRGSQSATEILPWIEHIIRHLPTKSTEDLLRTAQHRCCNFTHFVKLNRLINAYKMKATSGDDVNGLLDATKKSEGGCASQLDNQGSVGLFIDS